MKLSKLAKVVAVAATSMLCIALLAGCSSKVVEGGATFTTDNANISGQIDVKDTALTVSLSSNPTTGYEWTYEIEGEAVAYSSDEYQEPTDSTELGASGTQVYTFAGVEGKAGDVTVTFTYARPSDDSDKTVVTLTATTNDKGQFTAVACGEAKLSA